MFEKLMFILVVAAISSVLLGYGGYVVSNWMDSHGY